MNNYMMDVEIDETALDVEWLEQPRLVAKYGKIQAQCRLVMDKAEETMKVTKAELDKEIRANPKNFDLEKVTESAVTNAIVAHIDYQNASNLYFDAVYEFEMARVAVNSIHHRKEALENLVKLHGMNYFAGPSVPRDLSHEWVNREQQRQTNQAVASKIKRRK